MAWTCWRPDICTMAVLTALLVTSSYGQEIAPIPIEGQVGENITITCRARFVGESINNVLQIVRPSGVIESYEEAPEVMGRLFRVSDISDLTTYSLGPLMQSDNGTVLLCTVDSMNSDRTTIFVTFTAIITRTPESIQSDPIIVREGQTVEINFNVRAYPPPSRFTWSRNGIEVTSGNGLFLALDSFIANPTNKEHSGTYTLEATNAAGPGYYNFTLEVQFPPEFQSDYVSPRDSNCTQVDTLGNNNLFICASIPGTRLEFICNVTGNPNPTLNHSFSSGTPTVSARGDIVIDPVMPSSTGNYTCEISSSSFPQSDSTRKFQLHVGGPPEPLNAVFPRINVDEGTVEFTWMYNDSVNDVPTSNFSLTIRLGGQNVFTDTLLASRRSFSVPLSMLMDGQTYTVDVVVWNLQGNSLAISQIFNVPRSSSIVISASYLLNLLLFMVVVLLY